MQTTRRHLILILLIIILLIPGIHKLTDQFPPEWFIGKFQDSIIGKVPGGLAISFTIIVFLEVLAPLFLIASIVQSLLKKDSEKFRTYGFTIYYVLFIILTFGSFLVQDYDNGFKDFLYFVGIAVLDRLYFSKEDSI